MAVAAPKSDPYLAPAPPGQLAGNLRSLLGMLGPIDPTLRAQTKKGMTSDALAYVDAHTRPLINMATSSANRRGAAGASAITGLSSALIRDLGPLPGAMQGNYDRAIGREGALADAARASITGAGAGLQAELADKIGHAGGGPDSLAAAAGMTGGAAQGFQGEVGARGYSGMSALNTMGAADVASAQRLPGVLAAGAQRDNRMLQGQINSGLAEEIARINAQAPGMAAEILRSLQQDEMQKAGMRSSHKQTRANMASGLITDAQNREFQKAAARQGFGLDVAQLAQSGQQADASLKAQVDYWNAQDANADADRAQAGKPDPKQTQDYMRYAASDATTFAQSLFTEAPKPMPGRPGFYVGKNGRPTRDVNKAQTVKTGMPYAEAFKRMRSLLATYTSLGLTGQQVNQIVKNTLSAVGIRPVKPPPDTGHGTTVDRGPGGAGGR